MSCRAATFAAVGLLISFGCAGVDDAPPKTDGRDAGISVRDAGVARDGGALTRDTGVDAGPPSDAGFADAGFADAGFVDAGPPPPPVPASIFFVGNSFTFGGPVPDLVRTLAIFAGFDPPRVEYRAIGGQTLGGHRADVAPEGAPARVVEGWDVVVLQENSVRPTDAIGDPEAFKADATWFHDLARDTRADTRVILYETWARHPNHEFYPNTFADPADMQAQLRTHYDDAAERYIPKHTTRPSADVVVARVGDAWEMQLSASPDDPRLHGPDDYHAGPAGQYLNALVIYSTIYGRTAQGLLPLNVTATVAEALQLAADAVTHQTRLPPGPAMRRPLDVGDDVRVDFGPQAVAGWPAILGTTGIVGPLVATSGATTSVVLDAFGFDGTQEGGRGDNTLGWPPNVSSDTLWVGSFDGHDDALTRSANVMIRGLVAGTYDLELFASRNGDDGGLGRLTRFTVQGVIQDLDASDNVATVARFDRVSPDSAGELGIEVTVSPVGTSRFAYIGVLRLTRVQ